ncbi:MAG: hypothetical protein ACREBG_15035 [Pyrinomonadaceae bacterium]
MHNEMKWLRSIIIILAVLQAGWMTYDGARAFIVGDFVTPTSGPYAGQLGPWTRVVQAFGVEPRSSLMKGILVVYGVVWLIITSFFSQKLQWAWWAMLIAAIGALWYLPIGTISSLLQVALLIVLRRLYERG